MKLIKQTILSYREGSSDKVYEVDLCEVGPNRYVVNFRYGRRGAGLKDGSKTGAPVPRTEADKVFDDLVDSKVKKGYRDVTGQPVTAAPTPRAARTPASAATDTDARQQAVMKRLAEAGRKTRKGEWPLERAIWRAGELKIRAAAPVLVGLLGSGTPLRDYTIAWALGWCGDETCISALGRLYGDGATPEHVRRIACEALLKLSDQDTRAEFRRDLLEKVPFDLQEPAQNGPAPEFARALGEYLAGGDHKRFAVLDTLYLIDNEHVRPALLELAGTAPLRPNHFQRLRHMFKVAEYRRDAEMFGLLAYRFEKERAMFRDGYHVYVEERKESFYADGIRKTLASPAAKLAYGDQTRVYLRKRVWRTLRRLGELGDADYVKMAVGVLLPFTDADAQPAKESNFYNWRSRGTRRVQWDAFAGYYAFNHILYGKSPRYLLKKGTLAWRCRPAYKPGDPVPEVREESFPKLWEQTPVGLLHLLSESHCLTVHVFAVKALGACREFCEQLEVDVVVVLLNRPYEVTARFGFGLAQAHYRADNPDHELVLAVANCAFSEARAQAHRWIDDQREHFLKDGQLVAALLGSTHSDTRSFARRLVRSSTFTETAAKALITRLIAYLLTSEGSQTEPAREIAETLLESFGPHLRTIGMKVILDLLAYPMVEVQELGGKILLNHETSASELPESVFRSLIESPFESMRDIGVRLIGQLPDDLLINRTGLLLVLSTHALADVRSAIRPVIRRLGAQGRYPALVTVLSAALIEVLLVKEPHEGIHHHLVQVLKDDLHGWMTSVSRETAWKLVRARSSAAQEVGGMLLGTNLDWAEAFDTRDIVRLSNHEIKAIREAAQAMFLKVLHRFRSSTNSQHEEELSKAVRWLDSKWDDAREWGFQTFNTEFSAEDFTPAILVGMCDSVRTDVQKFGRGLITRFFTEAAGQEYMLKLSEHPSTHLQLFVTNFLERYAAGNPERLKELSPYFVSVLSRVNRAGVAKRRVFAFLAAEAVKSEAAALIVADILTRQSATIAIGDKASAIEILVGIHRAFPHIPLLIRTKPLTVRRAV